MYLTESSDLYLNQGYILKHNKIIKFKNQTFYSIAVDNKKKACISIKFHLF